MEWNKTRRPEVGEEFDTVVEAIGEKGDGVCKVDGFVVFVPNVQEGQKVHVKITKVFRKMGFAELVGEPSSAEPTPSEEPKEEPAPAEPTPSEEPKEEPVAPAEPTPSEEPKEEPAPVEPAPSEEPKEEPVAPAEPTPSEKKEE